MNKKILTAKILLAVRIFILLHQRSFFLLKETLQRTIHVAFFFKNIVAEAFITDVFIGIHECTMAVVLV
uniref:Uncharacterized protein n=1 Tax=Anaerobacillus isosaccharinicus TaxID=1532552 RepID=A0A1S2M7D2_9BACI|nr:hypothetical protein [Anaerobacillus isosaccharinicus]QOY36622.1 hypothetical protein AWH56_002805 [Anaerobacillus isosaccharinicus]